ncbi:MAG: CDP-diacylglycerol--serine O-phosphatidyltransferase [Bacteroidetes bacterium]|nr:MAG: CDP-diacylglycerol--serine O-phosphatidyltransferase [Bacteroidota bacterium]
MKQNIPNVITCLNILSGSIAVFFAFEGLFHLAAIFVGIAAMLDFLDGTVARLLNAYSEIGKELDSLADLISFGFAPSIVLLRLLQEAHGNIAVIVHHMDILPFVAFFVTLFSALRLAKFNLDQKQSESFIGLPTPANAIFIVSLPFAVYYGNETYFLHPLFFALLNNKLALLILIAVLSYLLISSLPLFSLKLKSFKIKENLIRYIFLVFSILLILLFQWYAISIIIIFYVILSLAEKVANRI